MEKLYTAPLLTVVSINVERGYAGSVDMSIITENSFLPEDTDVTETRGTSTNWVKNSETGFWGGNTFD